eukprot:3688408-Alexandrium_andersonii.AAC.1
MVRCHYPSRVVAQVWGRQKKQVLTGGSLRGLSCILGFEVAGPALFRVIMVLQMVCCRCRLR